MYGPAQERGNLFAVQRHGLLHTVKVGHGKDATDAVGGKASVDQQLIAVLIKDFCMDFKGQCVDDKLLFPCVAFGIKRKDLLNPFSSCLKPPVVLISSAVTLVERIKAPDCFRKV